MKVLDSKSYPINERKIAIKKTCVVLLGLLIIQWSTHFLAGLTWADTFYWATNLIILALLYAFYEHFRGESKIPIKIRKIKENLLAFLLILGVNVLTRFVFEFLRDVSIKAIGSRHLDYFFLWGVSFAPENIFGYEEVLSVIVFHFFSLLICVATAISWYYGLLIREKMIFRKFISVSGVSVE